MPAIGRIVTAPPAVFTIISGLDPAIAPGVNSLEFGGLGYYQATNLLTGIAAKGKVVGFDIVEIAPARDLHNLTSLLTVRLTLNLLGAMARNGQFDH